MALVLRQLLLGMRCPCVMVVRRSLTFVKAASLVTIVTLLVLSNNWWSGCCGNGSLQPLHLTATVATDATAAPTAMPIPRHAQAPATAVRGANQERGSTRHRLSAGESDHNNVYAGRSMGNREGSDKRAAAAGKQRSTLMIAIVTGGDSNTSASNRQV